MNIRFLRRLDRLLGPLLLFLFAPLARLIAALLRNRSVSFGSQTKHCVFYKLKGGGSLVIALPTLLALRRAASQAKFTLVCTQGAKIYAEQTGIFNDYSVIDDRSLLSLAASTLAAIKNNFLADYAFDLEPHGLLTALICALSCASQRIGFVKPDQSCRSQAYTQALSFDVFGPVYLFYDQLARIFNLSPSSIPECRDQLRREIKNPQPKTPDEILLGLAPFASELARERMMGPEVWAKFLEESFAGKKIHCFIFGAASNKSASAEFTQMIKRILPQARMTNLCGIKSLTESIEYVSACDEFWSIDSGLLHIARLIVPRCKSFWGPTSPHILLRPIDGLEESIEYHAFACSPCVHMALNPPCKGNNLCMKTIYEKNPDRSPLWLLGK